MPRNKIYVIVEGHGEADAPTVGQQPAAIVLLVKMLQTLAVWDLFPARRPWRMASCGDFYPATENLLRALTAHREYGDCAGVLILFDLEDAGPCKIGPAVSQRIRNQGPWPFSIAVVCAHREYESWFLASLTTIHPGHVVPGNPEAPRDAKGWLAREFGYREVHDQAHYTQALDVALAAQNSRSFRRLYHAIEQLVKAHTDGQPVVTP